MFRILAKARGEERGQKMNREEQRLACADDQTRLLQEWKMLQQSVVCEIFCCFPSLHSFINWHYKCTATFHSDCRIISPHSESVSLISSEESSERQEAPGAPRNSAPHPHPPSPTAALMKISCQSTAFIWSTQLHPRFTDLYRESRGKDGCPPHAAINRLRDKTITTSEAQWDDTAKSSTSQRKTRLESGGLRCTKGCSYVCVCVWCMWVCDSVCSSNEKQRTSNGLGGGDESQKQR